MKIKVKNNKYFWKIYPVIDYGKKNQPVQILGQRKKILWNKCFLKGKTEGVALLKHMEESTEKEKSDNQNYKVCFEIRPSKHENFKKGMEKNIFWDIGQN